MSLIGRTTNALTYAQAQGLATAVEAQVDNPRHTEPLTLNGHARPDYAWVQVFAIYGPGDDTLEPPAPNQAAYLQFPVGGYQDGWAQSAILAHNPNCTFEIIDTEA